MGKTSYERFIEIGLSPADAKFLVGLMKPPLPKPPAPAPAGECWECGAEGRLYNHGRCATCAAADYGF